MMRSSLLPAVPLAIALACVGCGLKGPLYLPDQVTNVEVHPAASTPQPTGNAPPVVPADVAESTGDEPADDEHVESRDRVEPGPQD